MTSAISAKKREAYTAPINSIKHKTPISAMNTKYNHFKSLTMAVYKVDTQHEELHTRDGAPALNCPTCGKVFYSKGWLAIHRRQTENAQRTITQKENKWKYAQMKDVGKSLPRIKTWSIIGTTTSDRNKTHTTRANHR